VVIAVDRLHVEARAEQIDVEVHAARDLDLEVDFDRVVAIAVAPAEPARSVGVPLLDPHPRAARVDLDGIAIQGFFRSVTGRFDRYIVPIRSDDGDAARKAL